MNIVAYLRVKSVNNYFIQLNFEVLCVLNE